MTSPELLSSTDPVLQAAINAGLDQVEQRLHAVVASSHPLLSEAAAHLMEAGGKRFRPLLTLLAAQFVFDVTADPRLRKPNACFRSTTPEF